MHIISIFVDDETTRLVVGCEDRANDIFSFLQDSEVNCTIEYGEPPYDRNGEELQRAADWISMYAGTRGIGINC